MKRYRIVWGYMNQNVGDYDIWGEALAAVKLLLTQGTQCKVFSSDYRPSIGGKLVGALIVNEVCLHHIATESDLLNLLQSLHDELTVECCPAELKRIARGLGYEEWTS